MMETPHNNYERYLKPQKTNAFALFVPLYLVLLAFFILLNSISEVNQRKTQNAIYSIDETFSTGKGKSNIKNKSLFLDFSLIVTNYFDEIEKELKSSFKQENIDVTRKGYTMIIRLPLKKIFQTNSSDLIGFNEESIDRIIKLISLERQGVIVKINLKVDSQGFVVLSNENQFQIDEERTSKIASKFLDNGIPPKNLTGGLAFNDEKNLVIETTVKQAFGLSQGDNDE